MLKGIRRLLGMEGSPVTVVQTPLETVRYETMYIDYTKELNDLRRTLDASIPPWQAPDSLAVGSLPLQRLPRGLEKKMKALDAVIKRMNGLAAEFKELGEVVDELSLNQRRITAVKITFSSRMAGGKSKTLEIELDKDTVIRLLQTEQQRLQIMLTEAQTEGHAALNAITPMIAGAPESSTEPVRRKIRTEPDA